MAKKLQLKGSDVTYAPVDGGGVKEVPVEVFSVRKVTKAAGETITHPEYGDLHAQKGMYVLTARDGTKFVVHPDDLELYEPHGG